MTDLKTIQLSESDFKMIVDGLDALPEKGIAGTIMVELMGSMMMKDDPEAKTKFENDRNLERVKRERERDILVENVKILQGKLLMFKRYLIENGLLAEADITLGNQ